MNRLNESLVYLSASVLILVGGHLRTHWKQRGRGGVEEEVSKRKGKLGNISG